MTEAPTRKEPKISINICTHRYMNPFFVNSMFYMLDYMTKTGLKYELNSQMGVSNIVSGRQNRVNDAIKGDCTHMLFIDDDMVFAQDMVHKMLSEANKLTIEGVRKLAIGVNPCRKSPSELYYTAKPVDSEEFMKSKGESGVAEASRCGLGAFLIETSILREIPAPHFEIIWLADKSEHQGEDFYFINKLREHGVQIFIDQDISNHIGHAGEYIFSYGSYGNEVPQPNS